MLMRRHHIYPGLFTRFAVVWNMALSPHVFLANTRRSHGGSLVDLFPISRSITTFLPRTICSKKTSSFLLIGTFLLEIRCQCDDYCILGYRFLIPLVSRLIVGVQVGDVDNDLVNINGGRHLYPSTLLASDFGTKIFAFFWCKTIKDEGEETLIVKLDTILAGSINLFFILLHQGK